MKASDFLALAALKRDTVEICGQTVHVRELSVAERAKFLSIVDSDPNGAPSYLVQTCTVGEDGSPMFSEADAAALSASSPHIVDKVAAAIMKVSSVEGDSPNV